MKINRFSREVSAAGLSKITNTEAMEDALGQAVSVKLDQAAVNNIGTKTVKIDWNN
jgi:hypothetical protein